MRRGSSPPKSSHCDPAFTSREWQVLQLLPTHLSIGAIGGFLGMHRSTAKTHVAHIYRKLGVSHRADAVDVARVRSLVPPPAAPPPAPPAREADRDHDLRG